MNRFLQRQVRKLRIRAKIRGTEKRPRLAVFRSNTSLYTQVINDDTGKTIASFSVKGTSIKKAEELAVLAVSGMKKRHIKTIVFDRSGYRYHGAIKAIAEAVRKGGLLV